MTEEEVKVALFQMGDLKLRVHMGTHRLSIKNSGEGFIMTFFQAVRHFFERDTC